MANKTWAAKIQTCSSGCSPRKARAPSSSTTRKTAPRSFTLLVRISSQKIDDVEKAYDFLRKNNFFDRTGKISRVKLNAIVGALQQLGDIPPSFDVERVVLPGVTQMSN